MTFLIAMPKGLYHGNESGQILYSATVLLYINQEKRVPGNFSFLRSFNFMDTQI